MKMWMALLLCVVIAGSLGACGGDEPEAPETTPEIDTPPGFPPDIVEDYESAPVPPPVMYGASDVRRAAEQRGLFEDMQEAKPEHLAALLEALGPAREKALASPGGMGSGPAGPSDDPTDAELVLAELGVRIEDALRPADAETRAAARAKAGVEGTLEVPTYRIVIVKVMGTGYVTTFERTTRKLDLGN